MPMGVCWVDRKEDWVSEPLLCGELIQEFLCPSWYIDDPNGLEEIP